MELNLVNSMSLYLSIFIREFKISKLEKKKTLNIYSEIYTTIYLKSFTDQLF